MKSRRQDLILTIISEYEIETQDELIAKLREHGLVVTQATISRDIRDLKLTKVLDKSGKYCYAPSQTSDRGGQVKFNHALVEAITSVDYAQNIVVIKTYSGLAQAVATGIDSIELSGILGCVAGDDTIFVLTQSVDFAKDISEKLKTVMKSL